MNVLLAVALLATGAVIGFLFAALIAVAVDDKTNEKSARRRWWGNE